MAQVQEATLCILQSKNRLQKHNITSNRSQLAQT